jgi:hypothetical protein
MSLPAVSKWRPSACVGRMRHGAHLPKCDAHFNRLGSHLTRVSPVFLVVSANRALGFRPSPQPDVDVQVEAGPAGTEGICARGSRDHSELEAIQLRGPQKLGRHKDHGPFGMRLAREARVRQEYCRPQSRRATRPSGNPTSH